MEGWVERVSELEDEMRRCEAAHTGMQQDVDTKDHRIKVLATLSLGLGLDWLCRDVAYVVYGA